MSGVDAKAFRVNLGLPIHHSQVELPTKNRGVSRCSTLSIVVVPNWLGDSLDASMVLSSRPLLLLSHAYVSLLDEFLKQEELSQVHDRNTKFVFLLVDGVI